MAAQPAEAEQLHALPADCGISQADALRGQLVTLSEQPEALHLDGSAVSRVSTAAVQLLLALTRTRAAAGRLTALHAPSEALAEAIGWLGLAEALPITDFPDSQDETDS